MLAGHLMRCDAMQAQHQHQPTGRRLSQANVDVTLAGGRWGLTLFGRVHRSSPGGYRPFQNSSCSVVVFVLSWCCSQASLVLAISGYQRPKSLTTQAAPRTTKGPSEGTADSFSQSCGSPVELTGRPVSGAAPVPLAALMSDYACCCCCCCC